MTDWYLSCSPHLLLSILLLLFCLTLSLLLLLLFVSDELVLVSLLLLAYLQLRSSSFHAKHSA